LRWRFSRAAAWLAGILTITGTLSSITALPRDAYFYSHGRPSAPSALELVDEKLPVDLEHFYTPPNALRLKWQSAPGGGWDAEITVVNFRNREINFAGDTLYMRCFATEQIAAKDLPLIRVLDNGRNFSAPLKLGSFSGAVPDGRWIQIKIPLARFFVCVTEALEPQSLEKHRV